MLLARAALAAGFLASTGCSLVVKTDVDQCSVSADCAARGADFASTVCVAHVCLECAADADCTARGAQFANTACVANVCEAKVDPKWGCIGHVEPRMSGSMVTVKLQILDIISLQPPKNLTIKLCNKLDPQCAAQLGPNRVADAEGVVTVDVDSNFQGYLDVVGADYFPALVFIDPVFDALNGDIQLITKGSANGLAVQAKVALDPATGLLAARTVDCESKRTAGVSVSIFPSDKETGYYFLGGGLSLSASATDSSGNSGFVNIAAGTPTLTATRGPNGQEIGKVSTIIRAGAITYQIVGPTSTP
jgi:hypothetical protein